MDFNEQLLQSWLKLTTVINNDRLVSNLPFNEMVIFRHLLQSEHHALTATDLCSLTTMQKSQMNRTLTAMEDKGLVKRIKDAKDKRKTYVYLNEEAMDIYTNEHQKIIDLIDRLIEKVGTEQAKQVLAVFNSVAEVAAKELEK